MNLRSRRITTKVRTFGEFGLNMEAMCRMVHAMGYDGDIKEYPRLEY